MTSLRLSRRMIHVEDAEVGERIAPFFAERRWLVRRHIVMAQLGEPERDGDAGLVEEVGEEELRPARHRVVTGLAPNDLTDAADRDPFAGTPWHKHVPARLSAIDDIEGAA